MGMLFLIWKELGMEKFPIFVALPLTLIQGQWKWAISYLERIRDGIFPMIGLAGIVKECFPMSGEAANGENFFYYDC